MKKAVLILVIPFLVNFASAQEAIQREFKVGMGKKLDIDLKTGGTIDISGWDKELLTVKAYLDGRDRDECRVDFNEDASGVQIFSKYASRRRNHSSDLKFEIKVPKEFDLEIQTMGGEIRIAGVAGEMNGKTMGGKLKLAGLKGRVDLTTMGGGITVKNSEVDGKVSTMGGEVLIEDVIGDLKGSSMGGNVIYRNVTNREGESTGKEVRISTMGGNINVDDAPAGANVHTMGGRITVKRAAKYVKAETMGGDIEIEAVDGSAKATTMGGDVSVTMVGDPQKGSRDVELTSMGGDITLTVPSGLSMKVDIQLAYTKSSDQNYRIVSDFDLQQEETKEWDRSQGTPRKYILGTGTIAGGSNKIKIETTNGNIYLKKAN